MKLFAAGLLFVMVLMGSGSFAQKTTYREGNSFSLTANVGASSFASSLAFTHMYPVGKSKRFSVGYGLRLTNFFGSDLNFVTAPAKFTSGSSSFAALFSEDIPANIDTISIQKVQTNFLNAGIYLRYNLPFFKNKFDLGVNIDAIGFTFGGKQNVNFNNSISPARPTGFNLLLISDSDIGSLNSEWYVSYKASSQLALKAGFQFLFTEYTTDTKIQPIPNSTERNDRFRLKAPMLLFGLIYSPFKK